MSTCADLAARHSPAGSPLGSRFPRRGSLRNRPVRGETVGGFRLALKLTIKSVWDYPEMERLRLLRTAAERKQANQERDTIIEIICGADPNC
ncbi:MAG: hypothetical protein KDA79_22405 [Planctomycetaceae bacterium]|nr:hypothetical protein [Planctomycetaceae bacterium]